MAQSVEQAIGRDRVRKALKRYENRPSDRHTSGLVREVNADGSFEVLLPNAVQTTRCSCFCSASVGDVVEVVMKADGKCDAIGRLGGESALIAPTIESRFEGIESEIDLLKTNKVLATAASYMTESQTITLSEAVSAQPNGIILVWSWYEDSAVDNSCFVHTFIPKHHTLNHASCGVCCEAICMYGHMMKYVYVHDTKVTGHFSNNDTLAYGGVTQANNKFVLRYALGV